MKVCIDIQSAITQRAGVGRYTRMLLEHLPAARGMDELCCFYFDFKRRAALQLPAGVACRALRWLPGRLVQQAWKRLRWPPFDWLAGAADVWHFPNFIVPPLRRGRAIVTIHDVSFLRHPEFTESRNLSYLHTRFADTVKRATAIITDSKFCMAEINELLPMAHGKVHTVYPGIGAEFSPAPAPALATWRRQRGLERPYLLSVGTLEPRKNFTFLLDVFERISDFDGDLVIAGRPGWKCEAIMARIQTAARGGRVHWLSDVADFELPFLYSGAAALVFPSIYEGFGFPPLEAMACGTPAITSAGGSLAEVVGDGGMVIPEFDVDLWAASITKLLSDDTMRHALIARGVSHARQYNWSETARHTWAIYRKAAV